MTEATRGDDPAGVEWGEVEALWAGFERALSEQLARMVDPDEADLLILEVPGFDDDVPGTAPYVQFAVGDAGEALHTEVSGNAYLERPFMLDDASCARMRAAGWSGPTPTRRTGSATTRCRRPRRCRAAWSRR
ncbi:TY-Chap domain-containing protein [Nocardioides daphniae]|uniref:TY-Chap domain-containing protein n=1 Tax=Nocardioides daphniae TaxID=402297 RepID=UPI0013158748|nr:hypothetical protein [Nocardioides daphniae]